MAGISRRRLLIGAGAAGFAGAVERVAASRRLLRPRLQRARFTHGVASGDPLPHRVILWTRAVSPSGRPARIRWKVATDRSMEDVVSRGRVTARQRNDWTVKVDAKGLKPGRTYYYRFYARDSKSKVGRTRTAPEGRVGAARLVVATCADYSRGLYNAYARIAERNDIDAVVHLGDYIYEGYSEDRFRLHEPPKEILTLDDYRARYAQYRSEKPLARMHARHPVIWVWDDHETVNGAWKGGAENHDPAEDGPYGPREAAALRAALEWLPIRSPDAQRPERIYRRFGFGDLIDLIMIDTRRIGRNRQVPGNVSGDFFRQTGEFTDPSRQILGDEQERWLTRKLRRSKAAWTLIGNQVVFSQIKVVGAPEASGESIYANPDQWDGYKPAHDRILDVVEDLDDVVFLTGDVHASLAFEVTRDPNNPATYDPATSRGAEAVEFVTPSISSAGDPGPAPMSAGPVERLAQGPEDALRGPNPHLKYIEAQRNGYMIVDVDRSRLRAEYWLVPTVTSKTREESLDQVFTVPRGDARLVDESLPG